MERTLSPEEKIKRAEEIYAKRRSGYTARNVATVNVSEEKNYGLFKKMILQIAICLVIYFIFYLIQNSNYVFSENVINKTKEILSYDINIPELCTSIINEISNWNSEIISEDKNQNTINQEENNNINEENNNLSTQEMQNAIGGAEIADLATENNTENEQKEEQPQNEEKTEQQENREQTDEEYIKSNFSFIKPIEGIVSSEFGLRNVDNPIVSKNHTGIDIAANTGTEIKAATDGTVSISSTTGSYGYHIQITNNDISTLYAHCSKLLVNVGDQIKQGQVIAKVGSTGNSLGPHLHFEIKRGNNYINPRDILEF